MSLVKTSGNACFFEQIFAGKRVSKKAPKHKENSGRDVEEIPDSGGEEYLHFHRVSFTADF